MASETSKSPALEAEIKLFRIGGYSWTIALSSGVSVVRPNLKFVEQHEAQGDAEQWLKQHLPDYELVEAWRKRVAGARS